MKILNALMMLLLLLSAVQSKEKAESGWTLVADPL